MHLSYQVKAETLGAIFRESLKMQLPCLVNSFNNIIVDRIEIFDFFQFKRGASKFFFINTDTVNGPVPISIIGSVVEFWQSIIIYTTSQQSLDAYGINDSNPTQTKLSLALSIDFNSSSQGTMLNIGFLGLHAPYPFSDNALTLEQQQILSQAESNIRNGFSIPPVPLDIVSLISGLGIDGNIVHAGIAIDDIGVNGTATTVELRIEFALSFSNEYYQWENFYRNGPTGDNNQIGNYIGVNSDWAILISSDFIEHIVQKKVTDSLSRNSSIHVNSGPNCVYENPSNQAQIVLTTNVDAIDACTCAWSKIDVNADITITITLSINNGNFRQEIHIDRDANNLQLLCCELSVALEWPVLGLFMLSDKNIDLAEYLALLYVYFLPIFGQVLLFSAAVIEVQNKESNGLDIGQNCNKIDDDNIVCSTPLNRQKTFVPCSPPQIYTYSPIEVYGFNNGPVIRGINVVINLPVPRLEFQVNSFSISYIADFNCSQKVNPNATINSSYKSYYGVAFIYIRPNINASPYKICKVTIINDIQNFYNATIEFDDCSHEALIRIHATSETLITPNTYPSKIFIQTTAGCRIITIDPPPLLTQADIENYNSNLKEWQEKTCFTGIDSWYKYFRRFNPKWLIDPNPGGLEEQYLWIVEIARLPENAAIVVQKNNEIESIGYTSSSGRAVLETLAKPSEQVSFMRTKESPDFLKQGTIGVKIKQVQLLNSFELRLQSQALAVGTTLNNSSLHVLTNKYLFTYDISNPAYPITTKVLPIPPIYRGKWIGNQFIAWNIKDVYTIIPKSGIKKIQNDYKIISDVTGNAFITIILIKGAFLIIDRYDNVEFFEINFEISSIVMIQNHLAISTQKQIKLFDPVKKIFVNSWNCSFEIKKIYNSNIKSNTIIVELQDGSWCLLKVNEKALLTKVSDFKQKPWFLNSQTSGNVLITNKIYDEKSNNYIKIEKIGQSRTL